MMNRPRPKILLVTTRNLSTPTGEWRLIANRSTALRSAFEIRTDVLYLRPHSSSLTLFNPSLWADDVFTVPFSNRLDRRLCCSLLEVRRHITRWLSRNANGSVVISGFQLYLAPLGIPKDHMIIDLHGTLCEWVDGSGRTQRDRMLRVAYPIVALAERRALKGTRGALVVSTQLATYAAAQGACNVWKIPCGVLRSSVVLDPIGARNKWRKRLSIPADATTFVYSGGLSKWQCVREAVQLFGRVREKWPRKCRMVIMTPRIDALSKLIAGLDESEITVSSVSAEEIGYALCACDIGLLLRDDNSTNRNAFPNKLAEYIAAGLFVITSQGLKDPSEVVLRHRIGVLIDPREVRESLTQSRTGFLIDSYRAHETQRESGARAGAAALDEVTMEHLVGPFARGLVAG